MLAHLQIQLRDGSGDRYVQRSVSYAPPKTALGGFRLPEHTDA
jgi:hypothetical protein